LTGRDSTIVLAGRNGSDKSSILEALAMLLSWSTGPYSTFPSAFAKSTTFPAWL
jgi:predicted ATPase